MFLLTYPTLLRNLSITFTVHKYVCAFLSAPPSPPPPSPSFPGADDNSLFLKFQQQHKKHSHFKSPPVRQSEPLFIIVHYAGDVLYQVKVWVCGWVWMGCALYERTCVCSCMGRYT